jgi:hypothetical protein
MKAFGGGTPTKVRVAMKNVSLALLALVAITQSVRAGSLPPTWIEEVFMSYPGGTGEPFVASTNIQTGGFSVADFRDPRSNFGSTYWALVDLQGTTGTLTVNLTYAAWNFNTSLNFDVPLLVYSYPSSAKPPDITSDPTLMATGLQRFYIPPGDYSASPVSLNFSSVVSGGGVCFLFETESDVTLSSSVLMFSVVPEPSSIVLGLLGAIGCFVIRRRFRAG